MLRTPIKGRRRELQLLRELLASRPIVTVVGPGGVGKTSLARALVAEEARRGRHVVWVDLESCRSAIDMARVLCQTLNPLQIGEPDEAWEGVAGKRLAEANDVWVVLDNLEPLLPEAAVVVAQWSDVAPEATFLVTSRAYLNISLESVLEVGSLEVDDGIELFLERLSTHRPFLQLTEEEEETIGAIVRRVDAIPLAIELAAARARSVDLRALKQELDEDFSLLDRGLIDGPERHHSMGAAIQSSLDAVNEEQRCALLAASLFQCRFEIPFLAAAIDQPQSQALRLAQDLRELSLLFESSGQYGVYSPVADFVLRNNQEDGRRRAILERHEQWLLQEASEGRIHRHALALVMVRFLQKAAPSPDETERTLRAACSLPLRECVSAADAKLQYALMAALQHAERSELGLIACEVGVSGATIAKACVVFADLLWFRGDLTRALERSRMALERARLQGLQLEELMARLTLCRTLFGLGRLDDALNELTETKNLAEAMKELRLLGETLQLSGSIRQSLGQHGAAEGDLYRARDLARISGAIDLEAHVEGSLGTVAFDEGRIEVARTRLERSRALATRAAQTRTLDVVTAYAGLVELEDGNLDRAEVLCTEALQGAMRAGNVHTQQVISAFLGAIHATRDNLEEAQALLNSAKTGCEGHKLWRDVVQLHAGHLHLARARAARTQHDRSEWQHEISKVDECLRITLEPIWRTSDDVRIAGRILERRLAEERSMDEQFRPGVPRELTIVLGREARWFSVDAGPKVDLSKRPLLRRLLAALATERTSGSTNALTPEQLVSAAWPNEAIRPGVHMNRLHVALSTLRSLGLREVIERHAQGYRFAMQVRIEWIEQPAPDTPSKPETPSIFPNVVPFARFP